MTIAQLRYFMALSEHLHFSRTAELLHISQPSLTQHISRLERELGVRLFNRSGGSVTLTAAGRRLQKEAATILDSIGLIRSSLRNCSDDDAAAPNVFTLAISPGAFEEAPELQTRLNTVLEAVQMSFPNTRLSTVDCFSDSAADLLAKREADLCAGVTRPSGAGLVSRVFCRQAMYLVLPRGVGDAQEFCGDCYTMMEYCDKPNSPHVMEALHALGVPAELHFCSFPLMELNLRLGLCAAVCSQPRLRELEASLIQFPIPLTGAERTRYLVWRQQDSNPVLELLSHMLEAPDTIMPPDAPAPQSGEPS